MKCTECAFQTTSTVKLEAHLKGHIQEIKAERDRYKATIEKIVTLKEGYQTLERLEVAREALK